MDLIAFTKLGNPDNFPLKVNGTLAVNKLPNPADALLPYHVANCCCTFIVRSGTATVTPGARPKWKFIWLRFRPVATPVNVRVNPVADADSICALRIAGAIGAIV